MQIFDTHAHYDDEAFDEDREFLLREALAKGGVRYVVNMGASMRGAEASAALAQKYPAPGPASPDAEASAALAEKHPAPGRTVRNKAARPAVPGPCDTQESAFPPYTIVYAGCGIHPDDVGAFEGREVSPGVRYAHPDDAMRHLRELCAGEGVICIGEIGLDYHWMAEEKEVQQRWFREQMCLAFELSLPINVHSRDAAQDTFDLIRENHEAGRNTGGIIHCYSGSLELAREYVKMGYHIGIGGVVTFKNAKTLKKIVRELPLSSLVTETDCPYLSPEPNRGKRNDSRNIRYVIEEIARLKEADPEETSHVLWENAHAAYRLL